jgi:hypothetical protein
LDTEEPINPVRIRKMKIKLFVMLFSILSLFSLETMAERAVVVRADGVCMGFVPNGDTDTGLPPLAFPVIGDVHAVGRDAGIDEFFPGSGKITCIGAHDIELDYATAGRGFACEVEHQELGPIITTDTLLVATPGGRWSMVCKFPRPGKAEK